MPNLLHTNLVGERVLVALETPDAAAACIVRGAFLGNVAANDGPGFSQSVRLLVEVIDEHPTDDRLIRGTLLDVPARECIVSEVTF